MISEKQLRLAAKELIEDVCALRDDKTKKPIVINGDMSIEDITALFKNAITLIEPTDKFSDATKKVIDEMAGNGEAKEEPEAGAEEPENVELTLKEEIEACETLKQLKAIALVEEDFKSIKGKLSSYKKAEDLKETMLELLKDEEEEAQKKAEELHKKNIADAPVRTSRSSAPAAEDKGKGKDKPEKKAADPGKKTTLAEKIDFFTPLIKSGKYTQKDLVELAVKEFPKLTKSTFQTFLTDAKNKKYSKFPKLVISGEDGFLTFEK